MCRLLYLRAFRQDMLLYPSHYYTWDMLRSALIKSAQVQYIKPERFDSYPAVPSIS